MGNRERMSNLVNLVHVATQALLGDEGLVADLAVAGLGLLVNQLHVAVEDLA